MFEKVKEEKGLRKLSKLGRKLVEETIELPSIEELNQGTKELEKRLEGEGRVNFSYTKNTIIGLKYAETHFNFKGISLLDNINNNKKIYLGSYSKNHGKAEEIEEWGEANILTNKLPKSNVSKEQIDKVKAILEEGEKNE